MRYVMAAAVLLVVAGGAVGAGATAPATRPAETADQAGARAALVAFVRAVGEGDGKTVKAIVLYTNPETQKAAEAMLDDIVAAQKVRSAAAAVFGKAAEQISVGMTAEDVARINKRFESLSVSVQGDAAKITGETSVPVFWMVKKEGRWRLDFDRSQAAIGPLPPKAMADAAAEQSVKFEQLAVDIRAGKYKSIEEVQKQLGVVVSGEITVPFDLPVNGGR